MTEPKMKTLWIPPHMFDRITQLIEHEFPNAVVTRYPDEFQTEPELESFFLCARTMTPPPPR